MLRATGYWILSAVVMAMVAAVPAHAQGLTGPEIAAKVNARDQGESVKQDLVMTLTDKSGSIQERKTVFLAKKVPGGSKSVIFFAEPAKLKGTAFLTYDFSGGNQESAQWLYLPAMQRSRRISTAERGAYFLGTDFTNDDIKNQMRLGTKDFSFTAAGQEMVDGVQALILDAKPMNDKVAKELGYGRARIAVNPSTWMVVRAEYWDTNQNPLKVTHVSDVANVQGILTPQRIVCENLKTGHKTEFQFQNIQYNTPLSDDMFTEQGLRRGF